MNLLPSAEPAARRAALWSFAYFLTLLAGYYVLRPLRDQMGIAGGVRHLPWLFSATFLVLLAAQPLYGALAARLSRRLLVQAVYHFFALDLLLFWAASWAGLAPPLLARVFFVWTSVFNLFAVTLFWSVMADTFSNEEGQRLFGFIGAGGTAGALLGPLITLVLLHWLAPRELLLIAALFLEGALFCANRLEHAPSADHPSARPHRAEAPLGGGAFGAFTALLRSPYLLGLAGWIAGQSLAATVLYLTQARLVAASVHGAGRQTALFAGMDAAVNLLTLLTQLFLTGRLIGRWGTGLSAALLPLLYAAGFLALAAHPALGLVIALQIAQRWTNFAFANPARQVFFTVLSREEKFKAKNLIDVVFYRASDAVSGWLFGLLGAAGLKLAAIALLMAPLSALWAALSVVLGRAERRRAGAGTALHAQETAP